MELNRDRIIKALEWCSELRLCVDCPMRAEGYFSHSGNACRKALMENALALIKELAEENERLRAEVVAKEAEYDDMLHQRNSVEKALETAEVNTVRNMQERLKKRCPTNLMWLGGKDNLTFDEYVDRTAKEMLR